MSSLPTLRTPRALVALLGGIAIAGALGTATASAADTATPQIVMIDPAANLTAKVRTEERRGNDVGDTFRAIGKGFVADLDKADIARLNRDPDVLLVEPDRPMSIDASPGAPVPPVSTATAPANDAFASSQAMTGASGSVVTTTAGATRETGEPEHFSSTGRASVWFTWTAPSSGTVRMNTLGSAFDTMLAAYSGSALDSLTLLAANDDSGGGLTSAISFAVTAGAKYRIAIDGWGGQWGAATLTWAGPGAAAAPANDLFVSASPLLGSSGTATGSTVEATREAGEPSHGGSGASASIWYRWTAPVTGTLTLDTRGSTYDTLLGAYTGSTVTGLSTLAENDDVAAWPATWSQIVVPVTEGTSYLFAIDGWGGASGAPTLTWTMAASAPAPAPPSTPPSAPGSGAAQDRAVTSWGQDRIDQRALPLDGRIIAPLDGGGVTAYIIDTGVQADHVDFGGRVQSGFDAVNAANPADPAVNPMTDCNGHGTHVAGTVGGATFGVAPAVSIIPVRVLSCAGSGSTSGVIAGIDWVTSNHQAGVPAVANMSLGGGYSQALNAAVRSAVADGITFAVAAGNSGADACGASPAAEPSAITVGATESNDAMAYYSNWGSCVDVFAPGSAIVSASNTSTTGSRSLSGTSMAAPHVAGAAALLLSGSTGATPATVVAAIREGATTNVISGIGSQSPNLLLDINSGIVPAVPAPGTPSTPGTPGTPSTPTPRGGGDSRTPTPGNPSTPPVSRGPGGIHSRDILATPRLRSVARTPRGLTIRMTMSKGATGYQVFANGRIIGRMAHTNGTIRATVRRGAKIQVRAITPTSTSALSNAVRS